VFLPTQQNISWILLAHFLFGGNMEKGVLKEVSEREESLIQLRDDLVGFSKTVRASLNPMLYDRDQIQEPSFQKWIVINSLVDGIDRDLVEDSGFGNLVLFLWKKCDTMDELVDNYTLKIEVGENNNLKFDLVVNE